MISYTSRRERQPDHFSMLGASCSTCPNPTRVTKAEIRMSSPMEIERHIRPVLSIGLPYCEWDVVGSHAMYFLLRKS